MTDDPVPKPKTSSELTDEHLAELLKRDAKNSSLRYSTMGMLPKRPTSAAPKPNTRFLKSILRETDTHNAALKKKEELEARIRLREIARAKERDEEHSGQRTKRRRVDDDSYGNERTKAKNMEDGRLRFTDYDEDVERVSITRSRRRERSRDRDGHRSRHSKRNGSEERNHGHGHRRRSGEDRRRSRSSGGRSKDHGQYRRSRYESGSDPEASSPRPRDQQQRHRRRRRSYSRSSGTEPSRSPSRHRRSHRSRHHHRESNMSPDAPKNGATRPSNRYTRSPSSDPLSPLLGPQLPRKPNTSVRSRGRGALDPISSISKMDMHFNPGYDPTTDIQPPSPKATNLDALEGDDWEQALEAHRDRQKWKLLGAERLKAAGFSDGDVKKWESGGEKTEEDVVWAAKGEEREWDRGKEPE